MDHSSLLSLSIYNLPSSSENPGSHHLLCAYLTVQFQQTCIMVSDLLAHAPVVNNYIHSTTVLYTVSFASIFTDSIHFQCFLGQHFPTITSVRQFHPIIIQLKFIFHSGSVDLLSDLFKIFIKICQNKHLNVHTSLTSVSGKQYLSFDSPNSPDSPDFCITPSPVTSFLS